MVKFTLESFGDQTKSLACDRCNGEFQVSFGIGYAHDGAIVRTATMACPNGHAKNFRWKPGESPPPELKEILS